MTADLQTIIDAFQNIYPSYSLDKVFVLIVERDPENGSQYITQWGLHSVGELAAWIVAGSKKNQDKEAKNS
jgi:hypothetical protein